MQFRFFKIGHVAGNDPSGSAWAGPAPTFKAAFRIRKGYANAFHNCGIARQAKGVIMAGMGLDFVELVMRTEEVFGVELPDRECESIRTVGDLYGLVLVKLELPYVSSIEIETKSLGVERPLNVALQLRPWTTPDVWMTLRIVIQEELGIEIDQITEAATFLDDLGCE